MTLDEKIDKLIGEEDHVAYQLLFDARGDWREIPEEFKKAKQSYRDTFEKVVTRISAQYGSPSYIEREWSRNSPRWAPMGLYADWATNDRKEIICVFIGGDGNPEDPLILLAGRTTQDAKASSRDPWAWRWIE
jgi:hypothetical protein